MPTATPSKPAKDPTVWIVGELPPAPARPTPAEGKARWDAFHAKYPRRGLKPGEKGVVELIKEARDRH